MKAVVEKNEIVQTVSNPKNGSYFEMKFCEREDVILFKHIENLKLKVADILPEETK